MARVYKMMLLLLLIPIAQLEAQNISIEPYYEKNIFGNQYGSTLAWEFNKGIQIGGFYQLSLYESVEVPMSYEFTGLYFKVPFYRVERLSLSAYLKGGLATRRFVIIVPGLETTFRIIDSFSVASVVSLRAGAPALGLKAIFRIF